MSANVTRKKLAQNMDVSPITFGGAAVSGEGGGYGFGDVGPVAAEKLLHLSYERGINIFDTAPIYGFGLSEKRIGKAFKSIREKVYFVSKSGVTWHKNKRVNVTNDPQVCQSMLEQSLRDLQTEYIDLYMIHWPDEKVDIRRPMEILARAKNSGKIGAIGLCNSNLEEIKLAQEIAPVEVVQNELNIFRQNAVNELFPYLEEQGIDFMSWGTLDKGIISGRVTANRKFDKSDCRSSAPWWKEQDLKEKLGKMEQVNTVLQKYKHTGLELALAFNLSFKVAKTVLVGAKSIEQLDSLIKAQSNLPAPEVVTEALKEI